jgi:BRCT domain type II-containing protein
LLLDRFVLTTAVPDESDFVGRDKASVLQYEVQELIKDIRSSVRQKQSQSEEETDQVEDMIEAIALDLDNALARKRSQDTALITEAKN